MVDSMSEPLLSEIDRFLAREDVKMSETTFGRLAVNDGKFVPEIRRGRRVWPETAAKAREFIQGYVPAVPAHIPNRQSGRDAAA